MEQHPGVQRDCGAEEVKPSPLAGALGLTPGGRPPRAPRPPTPLPNASSDELERARQTIVAVMDGNAGRGANARLRAARLVLLEGMLSSLSDEDLETELRRRIAARKVAP